MKILERYFFWESLKPFILSLIVITFVMMLDRLVDLLNIIIEKQLDILTIISLFSLSLPFIMALSVPLSVLSSSIMTFGRMSVDQELTAAKACGINIYKKLTHLYIISILLAASMAYFNDFILPETNHTLKNLMIKVTYRKPINAIKAGTFTVLNNVSIYASESVGDELRGVIIYNRESSNFPMSITAQKGTIKIEDNATKVIVTLYNGEIHEKDPKDANKYQIRYFKKYTMIRTDLGFELDNSPTSYRGDREMTSVQFKEMIKERTKTLNAVNKEVDHLKSELDKLPKNKNNPIVYDEFKKFSTMYNLKQGEKREIEKTLRMFQVEIQKKYALAFACFVFFLIGAPVGMMTKSSGIGMAFSVSAVIFIFYYMMLVGGEELGDRGFIQPYIAMWLPNFIFLMLGLVLTYTSYKEKSFFDLTRLSVRIKKLTSRL